MQVQGLVLGSVWTRPAAVGGPELPTTLSLEEQLAIAYPFLVSRVMLRPLTPVPQSGRLRHEVRGYPYWLPWFHPQGRPFPLRFLTEVSGMR